MPRFADAPGNLDFPIDLGTGETIFERFTESARQVVVWAQEKARGLKHNYIGTEHILLGLIAEEEGIAAEVLRSFGIDQEQAQSLVGRIVGTGEEEFEGQIPFTPRSKKVLELALREALSLGHDYVGTEHILLGLVREGDGVGMAVLRDLGADAESIRSEVLHLLTATGKKEEVPEEVSAPDAATVAAQKAMEERIEAVPTHSDHPATHDDLGRKRLAAVVAERIRRARGEDTAARVETRAERREKVREDIRTGRESGSFLVHIHAPWGAGKSSVLNFLAAYLRNRGAAGEKGGLGPFARRAPERPNLSQWIVVEFSAWKHQRLVPPWWWLLTAVQRASARELWQINRGRWLWFWIRDISWRLWNARVVAISGMLLIGIAAAAWQLKWFGLPDKEVTLVQTLVLTAVAAIGLATAVVEAVRGTGRWLAFGSAEGAVRFLKRSHDPLRVYRRRFRWLVRSAGRPLTVFIDDLDRCRSEYVVELLEGIQTLFVDEAVTYVVAADRSWLCESFARAYDDFEEAAGEVGRPLGYLFLEKTFQISLEIPPMSAEDRNRYWELLMDGDGGEPTKGRPQRRSSELVDEFAGAETQADVEQGIKTLIEAGEDGDEVRSAAVTRMNAPELRDQLRTQLSEFAPLLEPNPRSMKRLMNGYGIERDRLLREGYLLTPIERGQLALLTIFCMRWPGLYEHLRRSPGDAAYLFPSGPQPNPDFPFARLRDDRELRRVLDGDGVEAALDAELLSRFPARSPSP